MAKMMNLKGNLVNVDNIMGIGCISAGISGEKYQKYPNNIVYIIYLDGGIFNFKINTFYDIKDIIKDVWNVIRKDKNLVKNDYMILNTNYISNIKTTMLDGYYASYNAEIYTTYGAIINFDYEYSSDMDKIYSQLR